MQQLAEYTNFTNPTGAQELQLAALGKNSRVLKPLQGTTYSKLTAPEVGQTAEAVRFMQRFLEGNDLIIWVNALLDDLDWGEKGSKRFEAAMRDLGAFLGFGSHRPEDETGRGPDNLWALGQLEYVVIECKSGATSAPRISKVDTNQMNGSIVWFTNNYDKSCSMTPIIVHPKTAFEYAASPHSDIRIVNTDGLLRLRDAIRQYSIALATTGGFKNNNEVEKQLQHYKLSAREFLRLCTVSQGSK